MWNRRKIIAFPMPLRVPANNQIWRKGVIQRMIKVLVYSNEPMLSVGLESVLSSDPAFHLPATCGSIGSLREHLAAGLADLALLDLTPELSGSLQALQGLARHCRFILWANSISPDFA